MEGWGRERPGESASDRIRGFVRRGMKGWRWRGGFSGLKRSFGSDHAMIAMGGETVGR